MVRSDIPVMAQQLNMLADVYEKRQVSEKAAVVWFDTLKEFQVDRVTGLLISWPKTHGKFPVPAEVWRELNERAIDERERIAIAEKAQYEKETEQMGATPQGEKIIAALKKLLAQPVDRFAWAKEIVRAYEADDCLRYTSPNTGERLPRSKPPRKPSKENYDDAVRALERVGIRQKKIERVPGQDDEEMAA